MKANLLLNTNLNESSGNVKHKFEDDLKTLETKATKLYSKLLSWSSRFPGNKTATKWREQELLSKKS